MSLVQTNYFKRSSQGRFSDQEISSNLLVEVVDEDAARMLIPGLKEGPTFEWIMGNSLSLGKAGCIQADWAVIRVHRNTEYLYLS